MPPPFFWKKFTFWIFFGGDPSLRKCDAKLEELYNQRRYLRTKKDEKSLEELEKVEDILAEQYSESMYKKIKSEIKVMSSEDGGYNPGHLWSLKKKLSPKHIEPPTAMKDSNGKLLTTEEEIKAESIKHYKKVFENRTIDEDMSSHKVKREELCDKRLVEASNNITPPWTLDNVKDAIKGLNMGISKDPYGLPNELFKPGIAGDGLLLAVTSLMNKIKANPKE